MKTPRTLGRYEVVDLIAQGGMCALYRARDPRIGRSVAIKLLRPEYDTPELRHRFSREATAAGGLSHPNIVTIYDVGEHDGLPFIAMEYVRGETFADLVCLRPPLPLRRKLELTEEVCAGLAHAHEAGIVHRDIKPANLIVGPEGTVKILDFGIAKLTATGTTLPGAILGTINYMSPEQIKGTAVDARADIFSVGAVLYELLSHQPAFPGELAEEVFQQILNGAPAPITEYCPDIDPRLVRLLEHALEKDPGQRFQSIVFMQKELAIIRLNPGTAFTPAPPDTDPNIARRRQIDKHLMAARHAFGAGHYEAAIESCRQVLALDGSDERAVSFLDRSHAAINAQQSAARAALDRATSAFEGGNLTSALNNVDQALTLDPHNAEAQALRIAVRTALNEQREQVRIRSAVDEARRRFFSGDHQAALESLAALEAVHSTSRSLLTTTLEELRLALREIEERQRLENERAEQRRRIATLLSDVRAALESQRLDDASRALDSVRDIEPTVPELSVLAERLRQAQAAARLKADLACALGDFEEQFAQGELARAGDALNTATGLVPRDSMVRSARKRLDQAIAAAAAREAGEARRRDGESKIDDAAARLDNGDLAGAADMLKLANALVPHHPRAAELSGQLREAVARQDAAEAAERLRRQIEELIRSASQHLQSAGNTADDLSVALRDVNQALALDRGNHDASSLKTTIEELIATRRQAERVQTAIDNARRRFATGKGLAAIKLLEDYQPRSPEIDAALNEMRTALEAIEERRRVEREHTERLRRAAALLAKVREALRDQSFDAAQDFVSQVEEIDAATPGLAALKQQVHDQRAAAQRRAELERVLADLDDHMTRGEWSEASDLLSAAVALNPSDARVVTARERLDQASTARAAAEARRREIEERNAAAERSFQQGDLQDAARLLALAASLDPHHPGTIQLSERVAAAIQEQEAAAAAERLRRKVDELLVEAETHLRSSNRQTTDVIAAIHKINEALTIAPDHAWGQALKATAEEELATLRQAARIDAAIRNARHRFANGKHRSALQLLEGLDASHPAVAEALKELRGALQDIQERQRAEEELADTATFTRDALEAMVRKRHAETVDTPSVSRPSGGTTAGVAKPAEQAFRGKGPELSAAREMADAGSVGKRERAPVATSRQRLTEERTASDAEVTVFVPANEPNLNDSETPAAERTEKIVGEPEPTGTLIATATDPVEPIGRSWPRLLRIAAGVWRYWQSWLWSFVSRS